LAFNVKQQKRKKLPYSSSTLAQVCF